MATSNRHVVSAFVFAVTAVSSCLPLSASAATVVERAGFASISSDEAERTWTIASTGASLVLGLDPRRDFEIVRATSPSDRLWITGGLPDTFLRIGGQTLSFGSRAAGFVYHGVTTSTTSQTVQLDAAFDLPASRIRVTRHYAATSGSPTFETWTTITPLAGEVTVADLNAFKLDVMPGSIHWVNGLQGDNSENRIDSAFSLQQRELDMGEQITVGATGRSSEQTVPWIAIDSGPDIFYAGLMWSGAWSLNAERTNLSVQLTLGLPSMSTRSATAIEGPHAFFGVARGDLQSASTAVRTFIMQGIRGGRPLDALVTYNTWFAYGARIDEDRIRDEMDGAAALGAELFVVDAGWYVGGGRDGVFDFTSGLGNWEVDAARFPDGLRPLTDYAHERGMKFGIWVEPERVALSAINRSGLAQETWLAKSGSSYGSTEAAQLCLASSQARQWVLAQITRLIDEVGPDYVKWDNNFWINCDRGGHDHTATGGNFSHVSGLYDVLAQLRARYPDLLIENVSGGGNRLDLGMMRYSDAGWMDDRSAPSVHVRHILGGLSALFPPAYLLSFVMEHESEPLQEASDMPLYFRSRSPGILGLCFRTRLFSDDDRAQMATEIEIYKMTRDALGTAAATLLTPQAAAEDGPSWDVLQTSSAGGRTIVLSAIQWDEGEREVTIRPLGLRSEATYSVRSVDVGELGTATGAELMADGVRVARSPNSAAHIIILRRLS
jgi:alpha-galactosidase